MRFVYPEFLWALCALAVPVVIHLFNFRRYKTLYFSSLQFVKHVEQRSKSTQRLRNLLVLLARMLAYTCLILAFAQPYFPSAGKSTSNSQEVLAIHVDNSLSMTMKGAEGELLSEAKESARQLLLKAPLDTRVLLSTNAMDGIESRLTTKVEALDRLDKIEPSPMVRNFGEVVKWQKNYIGNHPDIDQNVRVQHIFLSDFQRNLPHFKELKPDSSAFYLPIVLAPQEGSNISIDSAWFTSPLHKVGVNNELHVKVSNHGQQDLQNVQLHFELGTTNRDLFIDIPAGEPATTVINFTDKDPGVKSGKLAVQDKQFFSDDDYYFTYEVADHSGILVLNGPDATASVGRIYRLDNFYQVAEIEQGQYTQEKLEGINLVVLNGVNEIPSGLASNLKDFAENVGTVALFPGKNVQSGSVNALLSALEMPVIGKVVQQSSRIRTIHYKDPFFQGVFEKEKENLSLPGVSAFYLVNNTNSSRALSIVDLQNGKSLLLRSNGDFNSFLFTSVLSPDYGSFTADILYTTILLRIGEQSVRNAPLAVTIGETARYPVSSVSGNENPIRLKGEHTDFIPRSERKGNTSYLDLSGTEALQQLKAGIYSIENGKMPGKMAVNYSRKESDIRRLESDEVAEALEKSGLKNVRMFTIDQGASAVDLRVDKPYTYWKLFIILAIIFLLSEVLILKLWKGVQGN